MTLRLGENIKLQIHTIIKDLYDYCFRVGLYCIQMRLNAKINISFNPNPSLEPKHTLFYYQVDYLSLQRMCSGLHQVTKTDKMPIRK